MYKTTALSLMLISTPAFACNWIADPDGCYVQAKALEESNKAGRAAMERHIDRIYDEGRRDLENSQRAMEANRLNSTLEIQSIHRPY